MLQRETTYVTNAIQGKQLSHQILCWFEMPVIFFIYSNLIIIVESKYFLRTILLLFACSEAELRLTVIRVRNDLL